MFRFLNKQAFKPIGVHYHPLQGYHLHRTISTTLRRNTDEADSAGGLAGSAGGKAIPDPAQYFARQRFGDLSKTVTVMHTKLRHLEVGQMELPSRMDVIERRLEWKFQSMDQEIKGIARKSQSIDQEIEGVARKFETADSRIYCLMYWFVGGFCFLFCIR
ncbi:hypothetical protein L873DRAFT_1795732 [Choiromyces venosus 120613-1]|uniref:Uncharacterized protein n=1 Tax=Choiromyces venosus 120613-1 TaxID=1336337 RepID=A0A3N4IZ54_9PEZI|nr:hypothetical protein L873DRAFT_1795732 [Choiromyces venosus 120613-1]